MFEIIIFSIDSSSRIIKKEHGGRSRFSSLPHCDETSLRNSRPFQTPSKKPHQRWIRLSHERGVLILSRLCARVEGREEEGRLAVREKGTRSPARLLFAKEKREGGTVVPLSSERNNFYPFFDGTYIFDTIFENYSSVANKASPPLLKPPHFYVSVCRFKYTRVYTRGDNNCQASRTFLREAISRN